MYICTHIYCCLYTDIQTYAHAVAEAVSTCVGVYLCITVHLRCCLLWPYLLRVFAVVSISIFGCILVFMFGISMEVWLSIRMFILSVFACAFVLLFLFEVILICEFAYVLLC